MRSLRPYLVMLLVLAAGCGQPLTDLLYGTKAGPVDASHSSLTISPHATVVANGHDAYTVAVALRDAKGTPVANTRVSFAATNTASPGFLNAVTTNAAGMASVKISSPFAGPKQISVHTANNVAMRGAVTFTPAAGVCNGNTTLQPPAIIPDLLPGAFQPQPVDMNNDGLVDLLAPSFTTIAVNLNVGGGHWAGKVFYPTDPAPSQMVACDLNGDTFLDVVALSPTAGTISVLLNAGIGALDTNTSTPISTQMTQAALTCADVTRDGKLDIVVADLAHATVKVFPGNGSGGFGTAATVNAPPGPWDVRVSDRGDVIYASNDSNVYVLANNGAGSLSGPVAYPASGKGVQTLSMGVLRQGSNQDIVTANANDNTLSVLQSNASGSFTYSSKVALPGTTNASTPLGPLSVALADMDGDGALDVVTQSRTTARVYVALGSGRGDFGAARSYNAGFDPLYVRVAEINGDSNRDVVILHSPGTVSFLLGQGAGMLVDTPVYSTAPAPTAIVTDDLNQDSRADLVVVSAGASPAVQVYINAGGGKFSASNAYFLPAGSYAVATTDIDDDGWPDIIATTTLPASGLQLLMNRGDGTFKSPQYVALNGSTYGLALGDFNGDGFVDAVAGDHTNPSVSVVLAQPDGSFSPGAQASVGEPNAQLTTLAVSDFNGDGEPDVAVAPFNKEQVALLLGNGDGTLGNATTFNIAAGVGGKNGICDLCTGDFDMDGQSDLAGIDSSTSLSRISLYFGDGKGALTATVGPGFGGSITNIGTADFNGDGIPDFEFPSSANARFFALIAQGDGNTVGRAYQTGATPTAFAIADFDGDGKLDVAVVNSGENTVSILLNVACP